MNLEQFERKVAEFALEQGWIPEIPTNKEEYSLFFVALGGHYKRKNLKFWTECENIFFHINIFGKSYNDLFEQALRMIKATAKNTKIKKESEEV